MQLCYIYVYCTRYIQSFPKTPFLIYMQYYNVAIQSCRNEAMRSQNLYIRLESILLVYRSKKLLSFLSEFQLKMIRMNIILLCYNPVILLNIRWVVSLVAVNFAEFG